MQPGSLSHLIESDAIAFSCPIDGPVPPRAQLYWRGPVLHAFDGRKWTPGIEPEILHNASARGHGHSLRRDADPRITAGCSPRHRGA
jgi:hypothetical protein